MLQLRRGASASASAATNTWRTQHAVPRRPRRLDSSHKALPKHQHLLQREGAACGRGGCGSGHGDDGVDAVPQLRARLQHTERHLHAHGRHITTTAGTAAAAAAAARAGVACDRINPGLQRGRDGVAHEVQRRHHGVGRRPFQATTVLCPPDSVDGVCQLHAGRHTLHREHGRSTRRQRRVRGVVPLLLHRPALHERRVEVLQAQRLL